MLCCIVYAPFRTCIGGKEENTYLSDPIAGQVTVKIP